MAIDKAYLHYLAPVLREAALLQNPKVACLSYPDLLMPPAEVAKFIPGIGEGNLSVRSDSEEICQWHGLSKGTPITDTSSLFRALGMTADFFDVKQFRGEEIIVDLNEKLPCEYEGQYDLVIDTGTLEHCFNVGQAFLNMCKLVKVGGVVITQAPMTKMNHGFWNFSPCVYENFFYQNLWVQKKINAYYREGERLSTFTPPGNQRFVSPSEAIVIGVFKRESGSTIKMPIQKKYLRL